MLFCDILRDSDFHLPDFMQKTVRLTNEENRRCVTRVIAGPSEGAERETGRDDRIGAATKQLFALSSETKSTGRALSGRPTSTDFSAPYSKISSWRKSYSCVRLLEMTSTLGLVGNSHLTKRLSAASATNGEAAGAVKLSFGDGELRAGCLEVIDRLCADAAISGGKGGEGDLALNVGKKCGGGQ